MCLLFFILWFQLWRLRFVATMDGSNSRNVERTKREFDTKLLTFPEGSNVQLIYCMTIGTYTQPKGVYSIGLTAGQAWQLPSKSSYADNIDDYHRRSRRDLYRKMESLLESRGIDGKACVLKAICNAAERNETDIGNGHFLQEIMHAIFTLPENSNETDSMAEYERAYFSKENCNEALLRCPDVF